MLIDTHCHLDFPELAADRTGVLARATEAGIGRMVTIATHKTRWPTYLQIARENPNVFCTLGVHPDHVAEDGQDMSAEELVAAINANPKVVGIGECGLDYYREHDKDIQARALAAHIDAAQQTGLPVIIHARDADVDMIEQLTTPYHTRPYTGLLHCFASGRKLAEAALEIGFYISFSGIVTFKNARDLQEIARDVPLERMLVETDAPFLAPVPLRGKINEPSYVRHTAQFLADLKGVPLDDFARITTANAQCVFGRLA